MNEVKKIDKKKATIRLVFSIIIIITLLLILFLIAKILGFEKISQEKLQEIISSYGALGPIVFIVFSFLQATILPIPGAVSILAGNYLFGPWLSYIYSFIGIFLGSIVCFFLGRKLGRKFVNWIVGDKETVDYYLRKLKGKETIILFFMFLLPFFPDDALCAIAGIMPINFSVFIFIQFITRITSIGATLFFMSGEIIPYHGWGLVVLGIIAILAIIAFIIAYKNAELLNNKLISFINKFIPKKYQKENKKSLDK
jgi:uncharacterized membrane protein YdjX (TVP38/TMEM64 family)